MKKNPTPDLGAKFMAVLFAGVLAVAPQVRAAGEDSNPYDAVAVEAYLYLYPLVVMDYTRRQLTNVPPGTPGIAAPMNTFAASRDFPTPAMHSVPRPNFDTLYSPAWVDLAAGPVLLGTPDTHGRYFLASILDMWTDVFASLGTRTTGTKAGHCLLTAPGWTGPVPNGLPEDTVVLPAPTRYEWGHRSSVRSSGDSVCSSCRWHGERRLSRRLRSPTAEAPESATGRDLYVDPLQTRGLLPAPKLTQWVGARLSAVGR